MSAFGSRAPQFDLYYAAVDKQTGQTVALGTSAPGVLAELPKRGGGPRIALSFAGLAGRSRPAPARLFFRVSFLPSPLKTGHTICCTHVLRPFRRESDQLQLWLRKPPLP